MDDPQVELKRMLRIIGKKLVDSEVKELAFLYLGNTRGVDLWHQLMSELVSRKLVSNCEEDLSKLMNYLKEIRRGSLGQIVQDYKSGLKEYKEGVLEENLDQDPGMVVVGAGNNAMPKLKRPRQDEETLLEENLSCSNLELCDSTFTDEEEDASEYDEEHALSDEEKKCHKIHADKVDECAKKSPDPQTQVGAVIVNNKGDVIGEGYNRMPTGCEDRLPWSENKPGEPLEKGKHPYVVYAVPVAIFDAVQKGHYEQLGGATVYVTLFPSNTCAQLIREVGISRVVYTTKKFSRTKFRKAARRILEPDVECRYYSKT